jgi:hypothetical protein
MYDSKRRAREPQDGPEGKHDALASRHLIMYTTM